MTWLLISAAYCKRQEIHVMAKVRITAAVTLQEQLAADIYDMRIKAPEIAESAVPGQFVSLYSKDGARFFRVPSVCAALIRKRES